MINIGVIGTGEWGKNHVRVYSELPDSSLVRIADLDGARLRELGKKFGVSTTGDYKEILNDRSIAGVSICTPAAGHYSLAKEALEAGKHVLVEKPIALDSREGEELVELAERKGLVLMVGHIFRFNAGVLRLREEIKKGVFGKIYFLYGSRMGLMSPRPDCGVIFDFAVHDFDTFCFILDDFPVEVTGVGSSYTKTDFEDVGFVTLKFRGNVMANVGVSWLTPKKVRELWLVGESKSARLDYMTQGLDIFDIGIIPRYDSFGQFKLITKQGKDKRVSVDSKEPLKEEIRHFLECVKTGKKPIADGNAGVNAVKIVEACYKSSREGRTVRLGL